MPWVDSTYLYTAYTGLAAAQFNGVTNCKKLGIKVPSHKRLSQELIDSWSNVKIVIVYEVSFMKRSEFSDLDCRFQEIGCRDSLFGGFSVIFAGDFLPV